MIDDFIILALIAGALLAIVAGPLGCVIVWRRMAYFGDTLSHASLLGIALSLAYDVIPLFGVILLGLVIATLLFWMEKEKSLSSDTLLGILSHSSLALGIIVLALLQDDGLNINVNSYLFGDILAVDSVDIVWMSVVSLFVLVVFNLQWRELLSISVHEELARVDGVNVEKQRFVFMLLLALLVAVAIKVIGILLITAMLIIPAAAARLYSSSPLQMIFVSTAIALMSVASGLGVSVLWDVPTGPSIVVIAALLFLIAKLINTSRGVTYNSQRN